MAAAAIREAVERSEASYDDVTSLATSTTLGDVLVPGGIVDLALEASDSAFEFASKISQLGFQIFNSNFNIAEAPLDPIETAPHLMAN